MMPHPASAHVKTYTQALAFGAYGSGGQYTYTVNGVLQNPSYFVANNFSILGVPFVGAAISGSNWTLTGDRINVGGNQGWRGGWPYGFLPADGQQTRNLLNSFSYNTDPSGGLPGTIPLTLTVTGLTPGVAYDARVYYSDWTPGNSAVNDPFTFNGGSGTQTVLVSQNVNPNEGTYLDYKYVAGANGTLTISQSGAPFLWSGFTNQIVPGPTLPATTAVSIVANGTMDLNGVFQTVQALANSGGTGGIVTNLATAPATLTLAPTGGTALFSGSIQNGSGGVSLVINGTGTQVLAGTNTFSGPTTVSGGGLTITGALENTPVSVSGGTLSLQNAGAISFNTTTVSGTGYLAETVPNALSGSAALTVNGGIALLSQSNNHSGATTVSGGTLDLGHQYALQNSVLTPVGGAVVFDQAVSGHAFSVAGLGGPGGLILHDNAAPANPVVLTVGATGLSSTYSGTLSGPGSLVKTGTGTLVLAGASSYAGANIISQGTLKLLASAPPPQFQNYNFEAPALGAGNYLYSSGMNSTQLAQFAWSGTGNNIAQSNGSAWGFTDTPNGSQTGVMPGGRQSVPGPELHWSGQLHRQLPVRKPPR